MRKIKKLMDVRRALNNFGENEKTSSIINYNYNDHTYSLCAMCVALMLL